MKLIAHRGNTHGPEEGKENSPDYIDKCLSEGYDAEIDARYDPLTSVFWLGPVSYTHLTLPTKA